MPHSKNRRRNNPHFLAREDDGSSRLRIRFIEPETALMEEASGSTPIMDWIHMVLEEAARRDIAERRATAPKRRPPDGVSA